jgi:hypothetical protein
MTRKVSTKAPSELSPDRDSLTTNRSAIMHNQLVVDGQLPEKDSADTSALRLTGRDRAVNETADLKAPDAVARHEQRIGWFKTEAARQASNRKNMARSEAAYDSEQWEWEDAEEVRARGQNPIVYNEIKPTIDWLIGTERRSRVDFTVVAVDEDGDDDAITKTKLLKYLDDVCRAPFERSYAANDCFKAGIGWLECGRRGDETDIPLFVGAESWRNVLWDSATAKRDLSNCRYLFRVVVLDLDIAEAILPDHVDALRAAAIDGDGVASFDAFIKLRNGHIGGLDAFLTPEGEQRGDEYITGAVDIYNTRQRVMLLECWSRDPVRTSAHNQAMGYDAANQARYVGGDPIAMKMRCSIMTEQETLIEAWSPYKHNGFPFVPLWAYRNARTLLPYSPIYPLLGPQEALNHRMSKSLFEASSNRMEIEASAIDAESMDINELRRQWNRPDGVAMYANGAIAGNKVREMNKGNAVRDQLMLAQEDKNAIRGMSGVTGENRGLDVGQQSGKAILAKQEQGGLLTAELFDNLLLARQMEGDLTLSLAEQYVVAPMTIRVAGEGGGSKPERTKINQPMPDGSYLNDISARKAHFAVGEQAWKQSYAESAFEQLMQVMTQLASAAPQVVVNLLDVVFSMHPNLPKKKAILDRIRKVNGQVDPDGKMTPEQQAAIQQQQAIAKAKYEAEMAKLQADIHKARAQGDKLDADTIVARMTALYEAAQAALVLGQSPGITPIADELLASSGFNDMSGSAGTIGTTLPQAVPPPGQQVAPPGQLGPPAQAQGHLAGISTLRPDGAPPMPDATASPLR